jgi:hypothetical protein
MSHEIQVGAILIKDWPAITQLLGVSSESMRSEQLTSESKPGGWSLLPALDASAIDYKIQAAGWNFFFMASEIKATFFGALGAAKIQNALQRILGKLDDQDFNCLEVTGIAGKHFLGIPYAVVSAHSRHIQQGCNLDSAESRRESQHSAEWAKG